MNRVFLDYFLLGGIRWLERAHGGRSSPPSGPIFRATCELAAVPGRRFSAAIHFAEDDRGAGMLTFARPKVVQEYLDFGLHPGMPLTILEGNHAVAGFMPILVVRKGVRDGAIELDFDGPLSGWEVEFPETQPTSWCDFPQPEEARRVWLKAG